MNSDFIKIRDLSSEGKGIGSSDTGPVFFVRSAVPGDILFPSKALAAEIEKNADLKKPKRIINASIDDFQIVQASNERVEAACPYFEHCGACSLQNLSRSAQADFKLKRVKDALRKIAKIENIPENIKFFTSEAGGLHYRNKITLRIIYNQNRQIQFALHKVDDAAKLLPIDNCLLMPEGFDKILEAFKKALNQNKIRNLKAMQIRFGRKKNSGEERKIQAKIFYDNERDFADIDQLFAVLADALKGSGFALSGLSFAADLPGCAADNSRRFAGEKELLMGAGEMVFPVSADSFFQVNSEIAGILFKEAAKTAEFCLQNIDEADKRVITELFCGTGTIGIALKKHLSEGEFRDVRVKGIEISPAAVADARRNAAAAGLDIEFICGACEIEYSSDKFGGGIVIADPPAAGMHKTLRKTLLKTLPEYIIYVSCDPATLARDIGELKAEYKLADLKCFDMFAQTMHLECIALLRKLS